MQRKWIHIEVESVSISDLSMGREWELSLRYTQFSGKVNFRLHRIHQRIDKSIIHKSYSLPSNILTAQLAFVEKDPVWDDISHKVVRINLEEKEKEVTFKIPVKGRGRREKRKYINAKIKLRIHTSSSIHYIADVNPNGWLYTLKSNGAKHPLPYYLNVEFVEVNKNRLYFRVLEGKLINEIVSIRYTKDRMRRFFHKEGPTYFYRDTAALTYTREEKILTVHGVGTFTIEESGSLLPKGVYDLELPYEVHSYGDRYQTKTRYAKTWFRIGHKGDHFLHTGRVSLGCLTAREQKKWTKLYKYLIRRRKDKRSIGEITIE